MKQIIVIIIVAVIGRLSAAQAFGSYKVAPSKIGVSDLCPVNGVCFTDGTQLRMKFELPCNSEISDLSFEAEEKGDELHVFVSAEATATNKQCNEDIAVVKTVALPNLFGNVILHAEI